MVHGNLLRQCKSSKHTEVNRNICLFALAYITPGIHNQFDQEAFTNLHLQN